MKKKRAFLKSAIYSKCVIRKRQNLLRTLTILFRCARIFLKNPPFGEVQTKPLNQLKGNYEIGTKKVFHTISVSWYKCRYKCTKRIFDLTGATSNGRSEVSDGDMAGACRSNSQITGQFWTHNSIINRLDMVSVTALAAWSYLFCKWIASQSSRNILPIYTAR